MKNSVWLAVGLLSLPWLVGIPSDCWCQNIDNQYWKAGVARSVITPESPIWMAGYAFRTHPSEGTLTDLWASVLVLEDGTGKQVTWITTDLLGFPAKLSNRIRDRLAVDYQLQKEQIILCSSHTHSGPVLPEGLTDIYTYDDKQAAVIDRYASALENTIVALVGTARQSMVPAEVFSGNGITRFQVNRRNNKEATITPQTPLNGPNDYAVPVLKVSDLKGHPLAIVFGYACHATTIKQYLISADYPGFAQSALEEKFPGACAMFFQGAGADQNPLPRGSIALAQQYGNELAAAVERVLDEPMTRLKPTLTTAYSELDLPFDRLPSKQELTQWSQDSTGYTKRWADHQLKIWNTDGKPADSYQGYPLLIWRLGDQPIVALGGEIVVSYAIELKKRFGPELFVVGYANDVMGYIPSETILQEGGYEGDTAHRVYGLPAKWSPGIQSTLLNAIIQLASQVGINQITP